jgi:26S proteasome regulatory subunit N8
MSVATEAIVHPLVLLSVTDHYNRVAKDTRKRVVGVLLGSRERRKNTDRVDITNSFAVPFEEELNNPKVWFLDHNFLETMYWMFKKVNTTEEIVGFYSSGPRIKENDLKISSMIKKFCEHEPVFVVIDVRPGTVGLPTTAYQATEEVELDGKEIQRVFKHISCSIEAEEAEEVGVEHLLRDINDPSTSTVALQIQQKVNGLTGLLGRLTEIKSYLEKVVDGKIPINNQITYNLQNIFNLLPNLNVEELVRSILVKTNDMHLVIYISSLIRSVLALHGLLTNKIKYKDMDNVLDRTAGIDESSSESKEKETQPPSLSKD